MEASLARLRQLVEARRVNCPQMSIYRSADGSEHDLSGPDCVCRDTGRVPDPAFARLLEVLTEECPGPGAFYARAAEKYGIGEVGIIRCMGPDCPVCHGTGFAPRNWKGWPDGALRGALLVAGRKAGLFLSLDIWNMTDEEATREMIRMLEAMEKLDTKREVKG